MAKERVGALLVLSDAMLNSHRTRLADLAARSRLPAAYGVRESVEAGGLMSYGPSFLDLFRRSAVFVDKILKGAKPADLPVGSSGLVLHQIHRSQIASAILCCRSHA